MDPGLVRFVSRGVSVWVGSRWVRGPVDTNADTISVADIDPDTKKNETGEKRREGERMEKKSKAFGAGLNVMTFSAGPCDEFLQAFTS